MEFAQALFTASAGVIDCIHRIGSKLGGNYLAAIDRMQRTSRLFSDCRLTGAQR
jgi:hypothetical protein